MTILTVTGTKHKTEVEYKFELPEFDCNAYAIKPGTAEGTSRIELYKGSDLQCRMTIDLAPVSVIELWQR